MDIGTVAGMIVVNLLMVVGTGFNIGPFIDGMSVAIVLGGTFGAIFIAYPFERVLQLPKIMKKTFIVTPINLINLIKILVSYAEKARREGLLALESDLENLQEEFLKKGIQLIVDGTDPELVKNILDSEVSFISERHGVNKDMMEMTSSLGPAFGMIGTLIGLILMLGNLSDPSSLGPAMAVALITTLYGSYLANVFFTPMATKLGYYSSLEILSKQLMIEGILSIQAGDNPKVLEEKLKSFLSPKEREALNKAGEE
ncbi:MAG: motility protein A [Fusobacteria bacterium]|nr:motility protein A [Fusobacteriota bacterium]